MISLSMMAASLGAAPAADPIGKWQVDFGETACMAAHQYSIDGGTMTMLIKPAAHRRSLELTTVAKGQDTDARSAKGSVAFAGRQIDAKLIRYEDESSGNVITRFTLPISADQMAKAEQIIITTEWDEATLPVGQMDQVADLLVECVDKLRVTYNVNGEGLSDGPRGGADGAKGDVRRLFSSADYPTRSLRAGRGATVDAFLLIDEDGKVVDCSLAAFGGDALLLAQTCAILKTRARFEPATDADCIPTKGSIFTPRITWRVRKTDKKADAEYEEMKLLFTEPATEVFDPDNFTPLEDAGN